MYFIKGHPFWKQFMKGVSQPFWVWFYRQYMLFYLGKQECQHNDVFEYLDMA